MSLRTQDVPNFSSFIAKSCLNDLDYIGQDQRSLCMAHPLMLVVICAKYGKNPRRTVCAVERTRQDVNILAVLLPKFTPE